MAEEREWEIGDYKIKAEGYTDHIILTLEMKSTDSLKLPISDLSDIESLLISGEKWQTFQKANKALDGLGLKIEKFSVVDKLPNSKIKMA